MLYLCFHFFNFAKEHDNLDLLLIWLTVRRKNSYSLAGMRRMMQKEFVVHNFFLFLCFYGWSLSRRVKIARFPPTFLPNDSMAENSITSLWCLCYMGCPETCKNNIRGNYELWILEITISRHAKTKVRGWKSKSRENSNRFTPRRDYTSL